MSRKHRAVALLVATVLSLAPLTAVAATAGEPTGAPGTPESAADIAKARGILAGRVTYRGKPVKNADVRIASDRGKTKKVRTNAKGRFSTRVPTGRYTVSAWQQNPSVFTTYAGNTTRLPDAKIKKVRAGKTARVKIALVPAATVTGRVVRHNGRPAKGAELETFSIGRQGGWDREVTTDKRGRYTLTGLPPGQVEIHAAARGADRFGRRGTVVVRAKAGRSVKAPVIRLAKTPLGTIAVEVDQQFDDEYVRAYNSKTGEWAQLTYRAKKNRWTAKVPVGRWRVVVAGTNVATKKFRVRKNRTVDAGYVDARSTRTTLTGQVLGTDGTPVQDGEASIEDKFGAPVGWSELDSEGRFEFSELAPGTHVVRAFSPKSARGLPAAATVHISEGVPAQQDLQLVEGYTVRGRIMHRGKGVPGISLTLLPGNARTDAKGKFRIEGVPKGTRTLRIRDYHDYGYRFKDIVVEVTGDTKVGRIKVKR